MRWIAVPLLILFFFIEVSFAQQPGGSLPEALNEDESQLILRERKPKSHVEATFKVSDSRLATAINLARDSQYPDAAQNLDVYLSLVSYADSYARRSTQQGTRDRNAVLKVIEQRIFRQIQAMDTAVRELPFDYRERGYKAINEVRKIRTRALDDYIGDGGFLKPGTTPDQ